MAQFNTQSFNVGCPECNVTYEADRFREADQFAKKHEEHTAHEMEWTRAEVDFDLDTYREWRLTCHTCDRTWNFMREWAAREFQEEHAEYTDHSISNSPQPRSGSLPKLNVDSADEEALRFLISKLEDYYEEGAYVEAIYAHVGDDPAGYVQARQGLEQLKRKGEVYQPVQHFYRTV